MSGTVRTTGSSTGDETSSDVSLNDLSANHNNALFAGAVADSNVDTLAHMDLVPAEDTPQLQLDDDDGKPKPKEDLQHLLVAGNKSEYDAVMGETENLWNKAMTTLVKGKSSKETSVTNSSNYEAPSDEGIGATTAAGDKKARASAYDMTPITLDGDITGGVAPEIDPNARKSSKIIPSSDYSIDGESAMLWGDDPEKAYFAYMMEQEAEARALHGKDQDSLMAESTRQELMHNTRLGDGGSTLGDDTTTLGHGSKAIGWEPSTVNGGQVSTLTPSQNPSSEEHRGVIIPNVIYVQDGDDPDPQVQTRNWNIASVENVANSSNNRATSPRPKKENQPPEQAKTLGSQRPSGKSKAAAKQLAESDGADEDDLEDYQKSGWYKHRLLIGFALCFLVLTSGVVAGLIIYRNHYADNGDGSETAGSSSTSTSSSNLDENGNPITLNPTVMPTSGPEPTPFPSRPPAAAGNLRPHIGALEQVINPTKMPTWAPTEIPTWFPTKAPSFQPITMEPTAEPTAQPSLSPTFGPTKTPTFGPTSSPSFEPTKFPTLAPTLEPSDFPSTIPTQEPSQDSSEPLTAMPTDIPSDFPSIVPTSLPTETTNANLGQNASAPEEDVDIDNTTDGNTTGTNFTNATLNQPTRTPTMRPTRSPTALIPVDETEAPSPAPSRTAPTTSPTAKSTKTPTTKKPTPSPTPGSPTEQPTRSPTKRPSAGSSPLPTTASPTKSPTSKPTTAPATASPTKSPTSKPTSAPTTASPTKSPTSKPTSAPTTPKPTTLAPLPPYVALDVVKEFLLEESPMSANELNDAESTQYTAMLLLAQWMASIPPQELGRITKRRLLQRWTLSILYLDLNGPNWLIGADDWMSEEDSCDWLEENDQGDCNGNDLVTTIDLSRNNLSGTLPKEIALLSNSLARLEMDRNNISGPLPMHFGRLRQLVSLDFTRCDLTGTIPTQLGDLQNLAILGFGRNDFTGTLPTEVGRLNNLVYLGLERNDLRGTIPTQLSTLVQLEYIALDWNALTGQVPAGLNNLSSLRTLILARNSLRGSVPDEFCQRPMDFLAADCDEVTCDCCDLCCVNGQGCAST